MCIRQKTKKKAQKQQQVTVASRRGQDALATKQQACRHRKQSAEASATSKKTPALYVQPNTAAQEETAVSDNI